MVHTVTKNELIAFAREMRERGEEAFEEVLGVVGIIDPKERSRRVPPRAG